MLWTPCEAILFIEGSFLLSLSLKNKELTVVRSASLFSFRGFFPAVLHEQWRWVVPVFDGPANVKAVFGDDGLIDFSKTFREVQDAESDLK
jgi:hypothetical protein